MHRNRVCTPRGERFAIPCCVTLLQNESRIGTVRVVVDELVATTQLESGDKYAVGRYMTRAARDESGGRSRGCEQRNVPGNDHDIEGPAHVECREIVLDPCDRWRAFACRREHRVIRVDADDLDAPAVELDCNPPGSTSGVEHTARVERPDKGRLAVHVVAAGGEGVETLLIGVAVPGHSGWN